MRYDGKPADVAEWGRIGRPSLWRRQPIADERKEPGLRKGPAVDRQRHEIARLVRPPRLAKAAGGEMIARLFTGRVRGKGDA